MVNDKTKRKSPAKSLPKKNIKNVNNKNNNKNNKAPAKKSPAKTNKASTTKKSPTKTTKKSPAKTNKTPINKTPTKKSSNKKPPTKSSKITKKNNPKSKRIVKKKKKVIFSPKATLKTYSQEPESVGCILNQPLQQLLRSCHITHERIADIINRESSHTVYKPTGDNSLKVFDTGSNWWNDRSPNILLEKLYDENFLKKFLYLIDYHIKRNQDVGEIKRLEIKNNRFKIVFHQILRKV